MAVSSGIVAGPLTFGASIAGQIGAGGSIRSNPDLPLVRKVSITPIQQRIQAVNDDKTLAKALHGDLNRIIGSLVSQGNYNADTIQLIIDTLAGLDIIVKRVEAVAASQAAIVAEQALINSYTDPTVTMSAQTQADGTVTVTIANHSRVYADPAMTRVAVTGGTLTGLALNSQYYVYYDDPLRRGGVVTYQYTMDNTVSAQVNGRHSLGGIATGGATDTDPIDGGGVSPPGSSRVPPYKRLSTDDGNQPEQ
jgi:hypothetical protein